MEELLRLLTVGSLVIIASNLYDIADAIKEQNRILSGKSEDNSDDDDNEN